MKAIHQITALLLLLCVLLGTAACGAGSTGGSTADSATVDEAAAEISKNINGMRFNMTLREFTEQYNAAQKKAGNTAFLTVNNWVMTGESDTDGNGVKIDYWHYDEQDASFTASVETATRKIVNIGCGTIQSNFEKKDIRDELLDKAALTAQIACGFSADSQAILRQIFSRTAEYKSSLWYKGYVFDFQEGDETAAQDSVVLFRVFPVTDELKEEWKLTAYQP